jgi:NhaP-type Na+/H+ or K+/H+ antiporter
MPVGIQLLIAFVVGGLLGFFFGWLKSRGRAAAPDSRLENELHQQVGQRETGLTCCG